VSPDGSRLFVTDGVAHAVAAIDTSTLEVVRTRFLPTLQNADATAITATDGHTVFVRNRLGGISAVDAQTLALQPEAISDSEGITGLRMNAAGTTLYLLSQSGFVVADRRGRIEHRWPNPGDATSIDPSVTVPGAGAYQCAC
jgi:DNA-binding beta-propeller fold protein YncE